MVVGFDLERNIPGSLKIHDPRIVDKGGANPWRSDLFSCLLYISVENTVHDRRVRPALGIPHFDVGLEGFVHAVLAPCLRKHLELDIGGSAALGLEPCLYRPHLDTIEREPSLGGKVHKSIVAHRGEVIVLHIEPLLTALWKERLDLSEFPAFDHRIRKEHPGELCERRIVEPVGTELPAHPGRSTLDAGNAELVCCTDNLECPQDP